MGAEALNRSRSVSVGLLVLADSEGTRYQVLIRITKSAIDTARYAVDNENMKTMTPNKIFWLRTRRPFVLYIGWIKQKRFIQKGNSHHYTCRNWEK